MYPVAHGEGYTPYENTRLNSLCRQGRRVVVPHFNISLLTLSKPEALLFFSLAIEFEISDCLMIKSSKLNVAFLSCFTILSSSSTLTLNLSCIEFKSLK